MPNHFHLVLWPHGDGDLRSRGNTPPQTIWAWKQAFTHAVVPERKSRMSPFAPFCSSVTADPAYGVDKPSKTLLKAVDLFRKTKKGSELFFAEVEPADEKEVTRL